MRLRPPRDGVPLLEHIRAHLKRDGTGLTNGGLNLPDEEPRTPDRISFAAGAMDGIFGHHSGSQESDRSSEVAGLIIECAARPSNRRFRRLYETVRGMTALQIVDSVIEELTKANVSRDGVSRVAKWLTESGVDREPVKVGIALLGVAGLDDPSVVADLGRHDEFTLFAAVALANGLPDPERELWNLAESVDGWGRIHCVEKLRSTTDPEIRDWILRSGFRNSIMDEYLAHIAATTGGLAQALMRNDVDRELLDAAGEILTALVRGGPAKDIDDYDEAHQAVEAYVRIMEDRAATLVDYLSLRSIRGYLDRDDGWQERFERGWSSESRERLTTTIDSILDRPGWSDLIAQSLESEDPVTFGQADMAAVAHGMDTFAVHLERLRDEPLGHGWYRAWAQADHSRAALLVNLARNSLAIDAVATGPSDAIGMGPGFEHHHALGWTLQGLTQHPGLGPDLVLAGLRSPSIQNRHGALTVLDAWPSDDWPDGAVPALAEALPLEPTPQVAERIEALIEDRSR